MIFSYRLHIKALCFAGILMLAACTGTTYNSVYPTLSDGKYDSEFPYRNCSGQLEEIANTLVKLDILVFYQTYSFSLDSKVSQDMIRSRNNRIEDLAFSTDIFSESGAGTATTIYYANDHIAFLGCAHTVDYPDTVITYYPYPDDKYIQVIAIKARQQTRVSSIPSADQLEILAIDPKVDIALLGATVEGTDPTNIHVFDYPVGNSRELEWGSFVYIMGYPLGHAMITRGIVSDPERARKGSFLIDAVFNRGFSGGPVIAVRDGVPNFEFVGMVKSSAAVNKYYLTPANMEGVSEISLSEPYTGELKLAYEKEIKYGITFSVSTHVIRDFMRKNKQHFEDQGYFFDDTFLSRH